MAAGLVTHNIVTAASGGTFTVVSWVPNTAAQDVGAVPVAIITDGTNIVPIVNNALAVNTGQGSTLGVAPSGAAREGTPALVVRGDGSTAVPHGSGTYSFLTTDPNGRLWVNASGTVGISASSNTVKFDQTNPNNVVHIDSAQLSTLINGSVPVITGGYEYEFVPISSTDVVLGATGGLGDYLDTLICIVATPATSQVQLKDGNGTAMIVLPANIAGGVGTYVIPFGIRAVNSTTPGWKVSTQAGVTVLGTGEFT